MLLDQGLLEQKINSMLLPDNYKDYCVNGIQVANSGRVCKHIGAAVTACADAINNAAILGVDVLLVHHGLFWKGDQLSITGITYDRVKLLIEHDIALLAYHLPLDEHASLGNNVLLGEQLGIKPSMQKDLSLMKPSLGRYADLNINPRDLLERLSNIMLQEPQHFAFGAQDIRRVAWCTGAAQDGISKAAELGADAYISGEVSERTFHLAKELGLHYYNVGHHASERFGVKALAENIVHKYDLQYTFIEIFNPV